MRLFVIAHVPEEAAAVLGVTVRELHRMIDSGRLRAYRIGRVVRIRRPDLEGLEGLWPAGDGDGRSAG